MWLLERVNMFMVDCPRCCKPTDSYEFIYDKRLKLLSTKFVKIICHICKYEGTHLIKTEREKDE